MKKRGLAFKVYSLLILGSLTSVLIAVLGLYELKKTNDILEKVTTHYTHRIQLIAQINSLFQYQVIAERNILLDDSHLLNKYKAIISDNNQKIKSLSTEFLATSSRENAIVMQEFLSTHLEWNKNFQKVYDLKNQNKITEAIELSKTEGQKIRDLGASQLQQMQTITNENLTNYQVLAQSEYQTAKLQIITIGSILILVTFIIGVVVFKKVNQAIFQIIHNLSRNSFELTAASSQISRTSAELSSAAIQQSSSVEETASSTNEMSSVLEKNLETAKNSHHIAQKALSFSKNGKEVILKLVEKMKDIEKSNYELIKTIENSNKKIEDVTKVISNIGEKTKIINEIVFQTKLLSFNASVEAARAGEHGRGFSVVAEEIGKLASMSGKSADDISQILVESVNHVEGIIRETKTEIQNQLEIGKSFTSKAFEVAEESSLVFTQIYDLNEEISVASQDIVNASHEQALGINEINQALSQLNQVTQINTQASNESSDAATSLNREALKLQQSISLLEKVILGESQNLSSSKSVKSQQNPVSLSVENAPVFEADDVKFAS